MNGFSRPAGLLVTLTLVLIRAGGIVPVQAWDWPADDLTVTADFGQERDGDTYQTGILLAGRPQPVRAAHNGEVVVRFEEGSGVDPIPHGLGNFIVVEHERQFRMLYGHLSGPLPNGGEPAVSGETLLGTLGTSGYATGPGLFLQVEDRQQDAFVNPRVLLPRLPDTRPPEIESVSLHVDGSSGIVRPDSEVAVPAGNATIRATVYDRHEEGAMTRRTPPFRIVLEIGGAPAEGSSGGTGSISRTITFDTISRGERGLMLGGRIAHDELYESGWTYRVAQVELEEGERQLRLSVEDYGRNQAEYRATLLVGARQ